MGSIVLSVVVLTLLLAVACGSYVITTPRKWTRGGFTKVCVHLDGTGQEEAGLSVALKNELGEELVPFTPLPVDAGQVTKCHDIFLPKGSERRGGKIHFFGVMGGKTINETRDMNYAVSSEKTFVQTDKFLYKPGQLVRFRILTLGGPFLKISTDTYPQVHIENPAGTRIAQWLNVTNENGLIHLEMQLTDEPDEGTYLIKVKTKEGVISSRSFKVEEYVLPRFEIKVVPPKFVLGTDEYFTFKVCADYTYGQPVKGNLTFKVQNGGWGRYKIEKVYDEQIFGCKDIRIESKDMKFNSDDYSVYRINVDASVVEEGTGVEISGSATVQVSRNAINMKEISKEEYLKPALPFTAKIKATKPDGSAAVNEPMKVCVLEECKEMTTDQEGILTFLVPPNMMKESPSVTVQVTATNHPRIESPSSTWRSIMYESSHSLYITRYYSPSNSSLVLHVPSGALPCKDGSDQYDLDLMFSTVNQSSAKITVQVVSRGQIQYQDTSEYPLIASSLPIDDSMLLVPMELPKGSDVVVGSIKIPITLKATTSPRAKVLVWYSRDDGEVVSEMAEVDISKCLENKVGLSWSVQRAQPGDQATVSMSAEPNSICSLGVVDKSVELLSSQNDELTLDRIFDIIEDSMIEQWVNRQVNDYEYCWSKKEKEPIRPVGLPGVPLDDIAVPLAAGANGEGAGREKRSIMPWHGGRGSSRYVDALKMFDNSGLYIITDLTVETRPCTEIGIMYRFNFRSGMASLPSEERVVASSKSMGPPGPPRHHGIAGPPVPAVAATEEEGVSEQSDSSRIYFPETWLWLITRVPETGVIEQDLTMPDTVTEWVGKAVCVHQEKGVGMSSRAAITTFTPFFAELTLPPSVKRGEILPVKISVFNYLEQNLPVKIVLHSSQEYEILPAKDDNPALPEESHAFGERSACVTAQDKVTHTIRIRPTEIGDVNITVSAFVDESYTEECGPTDISKRDTLVKPILVEAEGFPREKTWTKYICTKDLENNVDALDVWKVEVPSNIVEGSARGWVTVAGDLLGPTIDNLGSLIRMPYGCGEQNMLNFAPNIYIMQYLDATKQTTKDVADRAKKFMESGYQREMKYRHSDGSFSAFGKSDESGSTWLTAFVVKSFAQAQQYINVDQDDLSQSMSWLRRQQRENGCFQSVGKVLHKGMKGGIAEDSSEAPLTAYLLLALLEAGQNPGDDVVKVGVECLLRDEDPSSYTLALISYALALADHPKADTYIQQLLGKSAKSSGSIYWETVAGPGKSDAVAVETAGYAVLAMMTLDAARYDPEAIKIVKWISSKRNGQGGFVSTQDTVVALQALAAYSKTLSQGDTDVVVTVDGQNLEHSFFVKENNKLLQQMVVLPTLPTDVTIDMAGQGCILLQTVLRYNVPIPSPVDAFNLSVDAKTVGDKTCVTKEIRICAAYLLPDKKSNMAVIEVNLVSGYIPDKQDLKQLVGYGTGLLKRYEVDGSKINIYVDEFSAEPLCLDFKILREVDVENAKPGTVVVYDYYQPEFSISEKYTLPPNDECLPWRNPILDFIIVDAPELEPGNADNETTTVKPEDIEGLLGALDDVIGDY